MAADDLRDGTLGQTGLVADLYLDLLKRSLVRWGEDKIVPLRDKGFIRPLVIRALAARGLEVCQRKIFNAETREFGHDWPDAATMIGMRRLDNIQSCVGAVVSEAIPGDLVEAGVWRGGASIFMRGALAAFGDTDRTVWCADSFQGWPVPDAGKYPEDVGSVLHLQSHRAPSLDAVKENFRKFRLLDERVQFLPGWFKDTAPSAPIKGIALLRLDADMYGSTMDVLEALYAKVSPRGLVVMNNYGVPNSTCRPAVDDFRKAHGIRGPIIDIDGSGAYWQLP